MTTIGFGLWSIFGELEAALVVFVKDVDCLNNHLKPKPTKIAINTMKMMVRKNAMGIPSAGVLEFIVIVIS